MDSMNYGKVSHHRWHAYNHGVSWYPVNSLYINGKRKLIKMNHLLLPDKIGFIVDHINGDGLDNRMCNLRYATRRQNCQNRRKSSNKTSKYKGVDWNIKGKIYRAKIVFNGKQIHIGDFKTELEALCISQHGSNFPRQNNWSPE